MRTRSQAFDEWRRRAHRSHRLWRRRHSSERGGVVHYARTEERTWSPRARPCREVEKGAEFRRFVILGIILLACVGWLAALLTR